MLDGTRKARPARSRPEVRVSFWIQQTMRFRPLIALLALGAGSGELVRTQLSDRYLLSVKEVDAVD
jgi:hypothetical protein